MRPASFPPPWPGLGRLFGLLVLAACGLLAGCGGGLVASVGSGGSGVAEGTLSGFGSVIVDGVEYSEVALAAADRSALKLGQRVRLVFASDNTAQSIEVRPQLRGPVTAAFDGSGWLRVAGQWVRVVLSADDSSRSGITLVDGFSTASDGVTPVIPSGAEAVVYGSWAYDSSQAAYVLVATRVEALATPSDPVLLGGVAVSVGSGGFDLGSASGTQVTADRLPALAEGTIVALQAARSAVVADSLGVVASVVASDVQNASLGATDLSGYQTVRIGGLVNAFDSSDGSVTVQGTQLQVQGMSSSGLGNGQFLFATAPGGGTGTLTASTVQPRSQSPIGMATDDGTGAVTELKGQLSGVDWSASSVTFVLRGVTVMADAAQITQSCRGTTASQTLYVVVDGYSPAPTAPLQANAVTCTTDLSASDDM